MAFVNEYIPKEDIERIGLIQEVLDKNPLMKKIPETYKPSWVVDRTNNVYFMPTGMYNQRDDEDPWFRFRLVIDSMSRFEIYLKPGQGRSIRFSESPYVIVWDFIKLECTDDSRNQTTEYVIELFKQALSVYGYEGINKQVPNTVVKFNF